jgi:hypothetical protein
LNKVGKKYVKKVIAWLMEDHPEYFRPGEDYILAEDGYHITEKGQIPIAKEIESEWSWAVWKEMVDTALRKGIHLLGELGHYFEG